MDENQEILRLLVAGRNSILKSGNVYDRDVERAFVLAQIDLAILKREQRYEPYTPTPKKEEIGSGYKLPSPNRAYVDVSGSMVIHGDKLIEILNAMGVQKLQFFYIELLLKPMKYDKAVEANKSIGGGGSSWDWLGKVSYRKGKSPIPIFVSDGEPPMPSYDESPVKYPHYRMIVESSGSYSLYFSSDGKFTELVATGRI